MDLTRIDTLGDRKNLVVRVDATGIYLCDLKRSCRSNPTGQVIRCGDGEFRPRGLRHESDHVPRPGQSGVSAGLWLRIAGNSKGLKGTC